MDVVVNGERLNSAHVEVIWHGRVIVGCQEVNFENMQTVTGVKVVGNRKDAGYVRSDMKSNADITLLEEELVGLELSSKKDIREIPASDLVIVINRGGVFYKKVITRAIALNRGMAVKSGDSNALAFKINLYTPEVK